MIIIAEKNINMNVEALVELNLYGLEIYEAYYRRFLNEKDHVDILDYHFDKVKDGFLKTELWQLFHIFGPYLYMGNSEVPFVNNEIISLEKV